MGFTKLSRSYSSDFLFRRFFAEFDPKVVKRGGAPADRL
jgi:hypothetical protein